MAFMPGTYNMVLYRGDSYSWNIVLKSGGVAFDVTGATAKAEIRDKTAGLLITPLTCTITPPNTVHMVLPLAAWATIVSKGVWDLQMTYVNGDIQTVLAGTVTITPDVTDSVALPAQRVAV